MNTYSWRFPWQIDRSAPIPFFRLNQSSIHYTTIWLGLSIGDGLGFLRLLPGPAESGRGTGTGVSNADGANIQQYSCRNIGNQNFKLVAVGTPPIITPPIITPPDGGSFVWRKSVLTWFTSYPDPGSEECLEFNGCTWAGQFAALNGKQPESWVKANNIIAVHEKDFSKYRLKTFRIKQGANTIDAKVFDMCSDSDCNGCCTKNAGSMGFLIDPEKYTAGRFGSNEGIVDWTCLDCTP